MTNTQVTPTPTQTVVIMGQQKSVLVALLLTFFLGPIGLLYASVAGAIILLILTLIIGFLTLGVGLILGWLVSMIWAVVAVNRHNSKLRATT